MEIKPTEIFSYAAASIELAKQSIMLWKNGYEMMLIPSRGAYPFVKAARNYHLQCTRSNKNCFNFRNFSVSQLETPLNKTLYLPFTADFGHGRASSLTTKQIRSYWVKVIRAIVNKNKNDPNYKLFRYTRDNIVKLGFHDPAEDKFSSGKFIFVDTVISGQAVVEIAQAFEQEGLTEVYFILIVDENGYKMKQALKQEIHKLVSANRARLIPVDRLFTEDQGPAISGIWSVVVPDIMEIAREEIKEFRDAVGAGLYYWEVQSRKQDPTSDSWRTKGLPDNTSLTGAIGQMQVMLHLAMTSIPTIIDTVEYFHLLDMGFEDNIDLERHLARESVDFDKQIAFHLEMYNEHLTETKELTGASVFDPATTRYMSDRLIKRFSLPGIETDVSSSHCIRVGMAKDQAARIVKDFKEKM